jgi:hypothetical protein
MPKPKSRERAISCLMKISFGAHHISQVALDLITDIWLHMLLKRKIITVTRSKGTCVLRFTHFQIATKLARAFEKKDRLVALRCIS